MDVSILRVAVVSLGAICGLCLLLIGGLAAMGIEPPKALEVTCTIAIASLVGILVPNRTSEKTGQGGLS